MSGFDASSIANSLLDCSNETEFNEILDEAFENQEKDENIGVLFANIAASSVLNDDDCELWMADAIVDKLKSELGADKKQAEKDIASNFLSIMKAAGSLGGVYKELNSNIDDISSDNMHMNTISILIKEELLNVSEKSLKRLKNSIEKLENYEPGKGRLEDMKTRIGIFVDFFKDLYIRAFGSEFEKVINKAASDYRKQLSDKMATKGDFKEALNEVGQGADQSVIM